MSGLREMLIRHEGMRLAPYRDTVGKLTIGVGHNLDDKPISERVAIELLMDDIFDCVTDCQKAFPRWNNLDSVRQDVLIDMCFNLGIAGLMKFYWMLAAVRLEDWERASSEMLNSKWAKQVGGRADELAAMMRTGAYVNQPGKEKLA